MEGIVEKIVIKKIIVFILICLSILGTITMINDSQIKIEAVEYYTSEN